MARSIEHFDVQVGERGRLVLPAEVRRRVGVTDGDYLVLSVNDRGQIVMVPLRDSVRKARGLFRKTTRRSLADELMAERRSRLDEASARR